MSRALDNLTSCLIDDLVQLMTNHPVAAQRSLEISAPVLIESLKQIKLWAVDRRDIQSSLSQHLGVWLKQYPQPKEAAQELLNISISVCPVQPFKVGGQ
ncbi:Uncharacterised protein [Pseudomonas luteola]|uniref:Uncharacterized protein n=1 Tax=Pseudomonas luteola TaxID=47886 RepID=A0A2X2C5F9_PSELU|nr:hypothetical protein [Pseudomonas luteola]SPZ02574.1 Uncharacterised protein [Pseudomonas luteola]